MKVRVIGDAPSAAILAGLLAADKHEITWSPDIDGDGRFKRLKRAKEIRLNLPWGWLRTESFSLSSSAALKGGELGVFACSPPALKALKSAGLKMGAKNGTVLVLDQEARKLERKHLIIPGTTLLQALSLLSAVEWDPGRVEVATAKPWFILTSDSRVTELAAFLKGRNIGVLQVDDLSPYRNSLHIRNLLDLPIALCHATMESFLSYPEGREMAAALLEEGLRLYAHKALPLAKLPVMDPQDLLQRLQRKPREFEKAREDPGRAYGAALQYLLAGKAKAAGEPNDRLVRLSSQTGIDPRWNWAVSQRSVRALRVGFFRDPVELYNALF